MNKNKKIFMAGPWITDHEIKIVEDAMRNGWYENAYYYVETFQKEFAKYHDRKFGIMTPNCTSAIHLLLTALGIKEGDEVIVPECTWIATSAPVSYLRAKPVFIDIEPVHWCIDPEKLERYINSKTKAIIMVDIFGNMPRIDEIIKIADKHNLYLIEDSAEALGSVYKGIKAGKFGIGSVFSFHRTKTLCCGEGGMLVLDDEQLYERCIFLRDHGRKPGGPMYFNYEVTYKYMPFNLQAALAYAQFLRLEELVNKKREIFLKYKERLADIENLFFNQEPEGGINSVWDTALVFGKSHTMTKDRAIKELDEIGIPSRPFFYPLSLLPAYGSDPKYKEINPIAYDISSRGINLPCAMNLTDSQIDEICDGIKKIVGYKK